MTSGLRVPRTQPPSHGDLQTPAWRFEWIITVHAATAAQARRAMDVVEADLNANLDYGLDDIPSGVRLSWGTIRELPEGPAPCGDPRCPYCDAPAAPVGVSE